MLIKNGIKAKKLSFKNNTKIFSALNRQKNTNIRAGPKKQHSYKKKRVYMTKSTVIICSCSTATVCVCQPFSENLKNELRYSCVIICSCVHTYDIHDTQYT